MSQLLRTFDPEKVVVKYGNLFTINGFAEGTAIEAARAAPNTTHQVGFQGDVGVARSTNKTGSITFTLQQNADTNVLLSALQNYMDNVGLPYVDIIVEDPSGGWLAVAKNAWLDEPASLSIADTTQNKQWKFMCTELVYNDFPEGLEAPAALVAKVDAAKSGFAAADQAIKNIIG